MNGLLLDDEPDIGPEHYILVVGFTYPHLFSHLVDIGVNVDCILKVESEDYPASESTMPADDDNVEKDEKQLGVWKYGVIDHSVNCVDNNYCFGIFLWEG